MEYLKIKLCNLGVFHHVEKSIFVLIFWLLITVVKLRKKLSEKYKVIFVLL